MNVVRTSISEMYVDEDGILRLKILKDAVVDLEKIRENYAAYQELLGSRKMLLLIDSRNRYTFTKEAREYAAGRDVQLNRLATAFLVGTIGGWLIATIYIRFNKPAIPTKIFYSEEKALNWLRSFYVFPGEKNPKKK